MPNTPIVRLLKQDASYIIDIIDGNTIIPRSDLVKVTDIERVLERMLVNIKVFKKE